MRLLLVPWLHPLLLLLQQLRIVKYMQTDHALSRKFKTKSVFNWRKTVQKKNNIRDCSIVVALAASIFPRMLLAIFRIACKIWDSKYNFLWDLHSCALCTHTAIRYLQCLRGLKNLSIFQAQKKVNIVSRTMQINKCSKTSLVSYLHWQRRTLFNRSHLLLHLYYIP